MTKTLSDDGNVTVDVRVIAMDGEVQDMEDGSFWFGWFRWLCTAIRFVLLEIHNLSGSWSLQGKATYSRWKTDR